MSKKIDLTREYITRDGLPVKLYDYQPPQQRPILGAVQEDGVWRPRSWFPDGSYSKGGRNELDLFVEPVELRRWFVTHGSSDFHIAGPYCTQQFAEEMADKYRAAGRRTSIHEKVFVITD